MEKMIWISRLCALVCLFGLAAHPVFAGQGCSTSTLINLNIHKLTMYDLRGVASPTGTGVKYSIDGTSVTMLASSPVLVSGVWWFCHDWTVTGGTTVAGYGAKAAFTSQTHDLTLTWNWTRIKNAVKQWAQYD